MAAIVFLFVAEILKYFSLEGTETVLLILCIRFDHTGPVVSPAKTGDSFPVVRSNGKQARSRGWFERPGSEAFSDGPHGVCYWRSIRRLSTSGPQRAMHSEPPQTGLCGFPARFQASSALFCGSGLFLSLQIPC